MKLVSVLVFLICRESRYQNSILDTSLLPDNAAQTADAEDDTELLEAMYIYWLEVNKSADNESNAFDSSDDDRDAFDAMFCSWIERQEELRYRADSDEGDASVQWFIWIVRVQRRERTRWRWLRRWIGCILHPFRWRRLNWFISWVLLSFIYSEGVRSDLSTVLSPCDLSDSMRLSHLVSIYHCGLRTRCGPKNWAASHVKSLFVISLPVFFTVCPRWVCNWWVKGLMRSDHLRIQTSFLCA